MYRIVIIEDEIITRENIIKKINWDLHGFEIVGTAENGKEALEIIEVLNPDWYYVKKKYKLNWDLFYSMLLINVFLTIFGV